MDRNELRSKIDYIIQEFDEFLQELKLSDYDLENQIRDYPQRKARYNLALARMKGKLMKLKLEQKKKYYEIYKQIRKNSKVKLTEEQVKAEILTHPEYIDISEQVIHTEYKVSVLEAIVEAFNDFGRMVYLVYGKNEKNLI